MVEEKKFNHKLKALLDACGIDQKEFEAHSKAAYGEMQKIIETSGVITVSEQAELLEKYFTPRELAMSLSEFAAIRVLGKKQGDMYNTGMMFG